MTAKVKIAAFLISIAADFNQPIFAEEPYLNYPYAAAMYGVMDQHVTLFPFTGKETESLLPVPMGGPEISSDGKALYATSGANPFLGQPVSGLFKIEFNPTRLTHIPGSGDFRFFSSFSLRQRDAVVAGKYWNGKKLLCGLFHLNLLKGDVRQILSTEDCDDALSRTDVSLSPDSRYIVAIHKRTLELIDINDGSLRNLGVGFMKAAWSPDGKWIAAAQYSSLQARMLLFDGKTLDVKTTLSSSAVFKVLWSPDSKFLLARKLELGCGPDEYTYEAFEVKTAKSFIVESSRCKVLWNDTDLGWIDRTIVK